jgi:hypothetical protein
MIDVSKLLERIDEKIAAAREKVRQQNQTLMQDHAERQKRLQRFEQARDKIRAIAKPRLEALARRFSDEIEDITPKVTQTRAAVTMEFKSSNAFIILTFSVIPDQDFEKVIVEYDLEVLPVLMMFESHAEFRAPIDNVDAAALEAWLDDWIFKFVEFYVHMHESEAYGRSEYVTDPVVNVRFPRFAAAATLEHNNQTIYFLEERTRDEFARQYGIAVS